MKNDVGMIMYVRDSENFDSSACCTLVLNAKATILALSEGRWHIAQMFRQAFIGADNTNDRLIELYDIDRFCDIVDYFVENDYEDTIYGRVELYRMAPTV